LSNKRPPPTTKVIKLTKECSVAILNTSLIKKDPGCTTIECSLGNQHFDHALCDLGASVSVMPKVVFDKLNYIKLLPTPMCLQLVDQSVRYPAGSVKDVPVKIQDFFIPVDFVVLDMEINRKIPLILGRPFLSTTNAHIDVGAGEIQFNINGNQEKFAFKPKVEQCSIITVKETHPFVIKISAVKKVKSQP